MKKILAILPLMVIIVLIGLAVWLWQKTDIAKPVVEPHTPAPLAPKIDYQFYEVLPRQALVPLPDEVPDKPVPDYKADVVVKTDGAPPDDMPPADASPPSSEPDDHEKSTHENSVNDTTPIIQENNVRYVLQINSFETQKDADDRRAQVLLAGVNAQVVVRDFNGQTLYQVVSMPMNDKTEIMRAQQKLSNHGIDALVIEQRWE